jgi:hypothetical protein
MEIIGRIIRHKTFITANWKSEDKSCSDMAAATEPFNEGSAASWAEVAIIT